MREHLVICLTHISPYLPLEYDKDILKRKRDAKDIAKDIELHVEPFRKLKDGNGLVYEELVVKVPGAGVVASDIEISLSGQSEDKIRQGVKEIGDALNAVDGVNNVADDATIGEKELKLRVNEYG